MSYLIIIIVAIVGGLALLGLAIQLIENLINWFRNLIGLKPINFSSNANSDHSSSNLTSTDEIADFELLKQKHSAKLQEFLDKISISSGSYYIENRTMDFLREVLNGSKYHPAYEYYSRWIAKSEIPSSIKSFGIYVYDQVKEKNRFAETEKQKKDTEKRSALAESIMQRHSDKILKFLEIAYRKVSTVDEYGDENTRALNEEILRLFRKMGDSESELASELRWLDRKKDLNSISQYLTPVLSIINQTLVARFNDYYLKEKNKSSLLNVDVIAKMSGIEFEQYLIQLLKKCGVTDARGTSTTGDQGADVLFTFNGTRVIIQAKRYNSSVGNKAIQEVHAAKGFYKCDKSWVVTNSTFTTSAKALARQLDVFLMEGIDLPRFESKFVEYFSNSDAATGS